MRKFFDSFKTWRSIRKYLEKQVCEETVGQLLKTGKDMLDSMGEKVLSFTVIRNKETIEELNRVAKKDMTKKSDVNIISRLGKTNDFDIFYGAPTVIMVSVKKGTKRISENCTDIILKIVETAKSLGLATSWNSFIKYCNEIPLEVPENYTPYFAISIGYGN
ncbi:MAG: nitroreductase family protein [Spirochaetales bacterium]|nr:nitroreductase family protein [Spirochaetales bacterium]